MANLFAFLGLGVILLVGAAEAAEIAPELEPSRVAYLGFESTSLNEASLADINEMFLDGLKEIFDEVTDLRQDYAGKESEEELRTIARQVGDISVIAGGVELVKGRLQLHARLADASTGRIQTASVKDRAWNTRQTEQALLELAHEVRFHITPKARLAIAVHRYEGFMSSSAGKSDTMVVLVDGESAGEFSTLGPVTVLWIPLGDHVVTVASISHEHRQAKGFWLTEGTNEYLDSYVGHDVEMKSGCISSILIKDKTFTDKSFAETSCLELPEPPPVIEEWLQYGASVPASAHELVSTLPLKSSGKTEKTIRSWIASATPVEKQAIAAIILSNSGPAVAGANFNGEFIKEILKKIPVGENWRDVGAAVAYSLSCTGNKEFREASQKYLRRFLEVDPDWMAQTMRYYEQMNPSAGERVEKAINKAS